MKRFLQYFNYREWTLLFFSYMAIVASFCVAPFFQADRSVFSVFTSMIGILGVILIAKGDVVSHYVYIVFSILYSLMSIATHYYGEAIIYLFVMIPFHISSIISWKKNISDTPREVEVQRSDWKKSALIAVCFALLSIPFYYLLKYLSTDNVVISTLSLTTSCFAGYLMFKRSRFFSAVFAADDIFLLLLWGIKIYMGEYQFIPTLINVVVLTVNDTYSFWCWSKRYLKQKK